MGQEGFEGRELVWWYSCANLEDVDVCPGAEVGDGLRAHARLVRSELDQVLRWAMP